MEHPNFSQVIRIGCPRNLGVLIRAGRRPGAKANGILLFNECIYYKRLGLWLKSALDCQENDHLIQLDKADILLTYEELEVNEWHLWQLLTLIGSELW